MGRAASIVIALIAVMLTAVPAASTSTAPDPVRVSDATDVGAPQPGVDKRPEGNAVNVSAGLWAANLWLCEVGPCAGPGEGSLRVVEQASGIGVGLGAYALVIKYDPAIVVSTNPCDLAFGASAPGAARGPVDEVTDPAANADCADDGGSAAGGTCALSRLLEGLAHFACATSGQNSGPTGDVKLASLELAPNADLKRTLYPAAGNGVRTSVLNLACIVTDTLGKGLPGTWNGRTGVCGDLSVTVRVLEGDLDLDCDVDAADAQSIAARIGSTAGGTLYDKWYDLEPNVRDLDIDIKDVQKVFGRQGSTCQAPLPPQPPSVPATPPL